MTPTAAQLAARRHITAAAARRRPQRRAAVPPAQRPKAIELAYAKVLSRVLGEIDAVVRGELADVLRADAADGSIGGTPPAVPPPPPVDPKAARGLLRQMQVVMERATSRAGLVGDLDALADRTSKYSRAEFARMLKAAAGIDLTRDPSMKRQIEAFRAESLKLIRSQAAAKVERIGRVLEEAGSGTRVETVRKRIQEETGATPERSALIARDQVLKLNANMTAARHQDAGITEYIWRTSRDERVRPEHRALEGMRFRYDAPPVVAKNGDTAHPGVYFQCRCTAEPVIEGFDEPADGAPAP